MDTKIKDNLKKSACEFRLPRYKELPDVGLYLEQVVKYINGFLGPIKCTDITNSMISNYVKKKIISSPIKKLYYPEQLAYLFFITISKNVLTLENISTIIDIQTKSYTAPIAYDYFCKEMENMIYYIFGIKDEVEKKIGSTDTEEKTLLRDIIISATHSIYLNAYFEEIKNFENNLDEMK